jgi:hypothetical protein
VDPSEPASGDLVIAVPQAVVVWAGAVAAMLAILGFLYVLYLPAGCIPIYVAVTTFMATIPLCGHGMLGLMTTKWPGAGVLGMMPGVVNSFFILRVSEEGIGAAPVFVEAAGAAAGSVPGPPIGLGTRPGPWRLPG